MKMPRAELVLLLGVTVFGCCTSNESKWTWDDSDKNPEQQKARYVTNGYNDNFEVGFRPYNPVSPSNRPSKTAEYKNDDPGILVGPGGPTGILHRPVGGHDFRRPHYSEYNTCKCSYSFNCPDLVFGSCGKGKRYCCYNSNKFHGPPPAHYLGAGFPEYYPIRRHPYGLEFLPPANNYDRPHYNGGYQFPIHYRSGSGPDKQTTTKFSTETAENVDVFARLGKNFDDRKLS